MNRQQKIQELKKNKSLKQPQSIADYALIADAMQLIVDDFKEALQTKVEIADVELLIDRLEKVSGLKESLDLLRISLDNFPQLPEEVRIASVNEFIDAISNIKIKSPDIKFPENKQVDYTTAIEKMATALNQMALVTKANAPKSTSQRPTDFVPFRRVVKKGNTYVFDDQPTSQAAGAGVSTPTRKDSSNNVYVPVANADGTPIGGSSGGATSDNQTNGTQKSIVRGGAKGTTIAADVTSTSFGANNQQLDVAASQRSTQVTMSSGFSNTVDVPVNQSNNAALVYVTYPFRKNKSLTWDEQFSADAFDSDSQGGGGAGANLTLIYDPAQAGHKLARMRSISNATNSTGVGILAVGMVAQFDDTSPTSITENQFGNVRMSANRNLYVTLRDAAGNERGLNINASGQMGVDTELPPAAALADATANPTTTSVGVFPHLLDGAGVWDRQYSADGFTTDTIGGGGAAVQLGLMHDPSQSGTKFVRMKGDTKGLKVKDDYQAGEILADQVGAAAVLTFTFANPMDFIWVTDIGTVTTNISRVDPFGGTPSATLGVPVFNQAQTPISVTPARTIIKIYAPVGATISMYGHRRTA